MKLITFDFWNTLFLDQHEGVRHGKRIRFTHEVLLPYRNSLQPEEVEAAFQVAHRFYLQQWENRIACTMDHHVGKMLRCLDLEPAAEHRMQIVDFFESILIDHPPAIINGAAEAVAFAASRMKVGLISDTGYTPGRTLRTILASHGIEQHFDAFSFSNETGFLKPNPQTFHAILRQLNIAPEEAVHIGDLEDTDIAGAKAVGMKAIKYIGSNPQALRESIADAVIEDLKELENLLL